MQTADTRKQLPANVTRQDAIFNIGRVALLINSLSTGDLVNLEIATKDRLHQPTRQKSFPPMKTIINAAIRAGALGAFLSGSGSSVIALANEREVSIGYEMADAARRMDMPCKIEVTKPSAQGAYTTGGNLQKQK